MPLTLEIYFDAACTDKLSSGTQVNPDYVVGSGPGGFIDERALWIKKTGTAEFYTNLVVTAVNDGSGIEVQFAPDESGVPGAYADTLNLGSFAYPNSDSAETIKIWRRVTVAAGTATQVKKTILYRFTANENTILFERASTAYDEDGVQYAENIPIYEEI